MSGNPRGRGGGGGRGDGGQRGGQRGGRGDFAPRGGRGDFAPRGGRGDFRGGRGDGGPPRGGGRGDFRGGRGGGMAMRGGPPGRGGIYLDGQPIPQPDAEVRSVEDALVKETRGKIIDGFPGRRGYGTKGKAITLRTNYFTLTTAYEAKKKEVTLYRYEIDISQDLSKQKRRRAIDTILADDVFKKLGWATDYGTILVTNSKLDLETLMGGAKTKKLTLPPEGGAPVFASSDTEGVPDFVKQARDRNAFEFRINYQSSFDPRHIIEYLKSRQGGATYAGNGDVVQLFNIILAKTPNSADAVRAVGQNNFYPFHGHPGIDGYDLGGGLEALRGYYTSVRPAINRLLVNLNVTSGAFFKPLPVIDLLREFNGSPDQQEAFIRMLKVRCPYIKDGQTTPFMTKIKTIVGFAKPTDRDRRVKRFGNAKEVKFSYTDTTKPNPKPTDTTVFDYFKKHHGITLQRPNVPVFNVGTRADPQYMPPELCTVLPGQAYRRFLSGDQTSEMLKFAARAPNLNAQSIAGTPGAPGNGLRLFRLADPPGQPDPQEQSVGPFGFRVGTQMITVPGRVLDSPKVKYGNKQIVPRGGSWNCAEQKFSKPGRFTRWQTLIISRKGPRGDALRGNPEQTIAKLGSFLQSYGLNMGDRGPTAQLLLESLTVQNREYNDRQLKQAFQKAETNRVDMLFIVIPEADKWLYARIKYFGDVEHGIGTICSVGSKLEKENGQGMYFGNLALKFNLKGGGVSHTVENTVVKPIDNNTMLVGVDVTHPSPGSTDGAPSIATMVASTDANMFQWPGSIRTQTGRQEMVDAIEDMLSERLDLWVKKNRTLPTKIVVYRDGVSEGQYNLVLQHELPSFEKTFEKRYGAKDKWPKIAIIIVGKRHHTRFYPTRQEDADYNPQRDKGSWNPLPGTVVDRGIAHKVLREFWLQAHQGLQGTARPAHYVVIKDDISFEADELEQFTHHLCYLFNRATKAVSICPPAYYADLLAERGRAYLFSTLAENHGSDSSVFDGTNEWTGGVHARLRETTWYV
ncbi:uncharacterized protein CLAFUR5_06458 [Fulvia fulva]|uniref:Piwi-domain-containing protein n=1 Tax=Passalora fulva TaxID=5499 RepID=A0A9Q8LGX4_PASFU|nr:uncharacterized protein CLAFUR5_06458 [Fulvia fulva]UJO17421.1 hypothetical protein CLAFUR5_06458 [Fulvia fulva]WPV29515.1 hypothetical protein CLAFUW7_06312 [Fulvia fulva]